jgi:hypothetical protein
MAAQGTGQTPHAPLQVAHDAVSAVCGMLPRTSCTGTASVSRVFSGKSSSVSPSKNVIVDSGIRVLVDGVR